MVSLTGIPRLAGLANNVLLLTAMLDGGQIWLAILVALNIALALYYIAVIAEMYLKALLYQERLSEGQVLRSPQG
ncbi:MAG: hypothetical protein ABI901_09205 [Roseiflexaceae bacterium]